MNTSSLKRSFLVSTCLILMFAVRNESQTLDSVRIAVKGKIEQGVFVHSLERENARYLSIFDVARVLGFNSYYNPTIKKLEVNFDKAKIKFTADNPFFIVTDRTTLRQNILQFPAPVLEFHDTLFAPAPFLLTVVNSFSTLPVEMQETSAMPESAAVAKELNVTGAVFDGKKNGTLIRIFTKQKFPDISRFIRNNEWLYVTISNGRGDTLAFNETKPNAFIYELVAVQSPTALQLSFHMRQKFETAEIFQDSVSNDIFVTLQTAVVEPSEKEDSLYAHRRNEELAKASLQNEPPVTPPAPKDSSVGEGASPAKSIHPKNLAVKQTGNENTSSRVHAPGMEKEDKGEEIQHHKEMLAQLEKKKARWKLDVVVIDPGHGGNDPGSIGIIGTREKDITLGIGLKLGKLIATYLPDVKVIYTRKTDHFVELYRRGQIANENEGKLFISIHCNSLEQKPSPTHGFEIYLLRPGKTEDAIKIAQKENAVVQLEQDYQDRYQEITPENFIILTMAQSAYMRNSENFAEILQQEMSHNLSSKSRSVKQAGFYVLVGASMPNVLIETGYLSNRKDEMFLRSPEGQEVIAQDILRALEQYKKEYEKAIEG